MQQKSDCKTKLEIFKDLLTLNLNLEFVLACKLRGTVNIASKLQKTFFIPFLDPLSYGFLIGVIFNWNSISTSCFGSSFLCGFAIMSHIMGKSQNLENPKRDVKIKLAKLVVLVTHFLPLKETPEKMLTV